jgi:hypothetical protein
MKRRTGFCANCGAYAGVRRWCADCVRAAFKLFVVELLVAIALAVVWKFWR